MDSAHASGNSNTIRGQLCEDKKGNIWFCTETGIYYFDRQKQVVVHSIVWNTKPELKQYAWCELKNIDGLGNLYLVCYNKGVLQYNTESHAMREYHFQPPVSMSADALFSAMDKKGNIWLRRGRTGVFLFDLTTKRFTPYFVGKEITGMTFGRKKRYISTLDRVYIADSALHIYDSIAVPEALRAAARVIHEDGYERPWLITYNKGILRYDSATKSLVVPTEEKLAALCANPVCMFNDRNNNLWIGTDNSGTCRMDLKPGRFAGFPQLKDNEAVVSKYFTKCICEDATGVVWFGTFGNGFFKLNRRTNELKGSEMAGNVVGAIARDEHNNMWVGGNKGLFVFRSGRHQKIDLGAVPPKTTDQFVSALLCIGGERMVVSTAIGLFIIDLHGEKTVVERIKTNFPRIGDISAEPGMLWVNVRSRGVYKIAPGKDTSYILDTIYPQSNTSCIHKDDQDGAILWIGADKGLVRYDTLTKKMRIYNEADGLGNSHVYAILEDETHKLWLSTNGGIYSFDKGAGAFKNYTVKDGLQSNEFNTDCAYKSYRGTLYFGGINGFNWFEPAMPAQNTVPPMLDIAAISIDDTLAGRQDWNKDSTIIMPYGKKTIRFLFAVLDYTMPEANAIMYTLGDSDGKWYKANDRIVQYASLAPGDYTLSVKAVNSAGVESAVKKIRFTILPPFWQTAWFALIGAGVAIAIIVVVTRSIAQRKLKARLAELEKIKEIDKERLRISREMHDDIGAGLTQITLISEMARNKPAAADSKELQDIALTSRRLVSNMNEIIWSLNAEGRTVEHLFAYMRENLNKLLEYSGIEYSISFPEQVPDIALSNEQRRNLLLIVKEAANNAVKYSKASNIRISATLTATTLAFSIADDGVGFNTAQVQVGNGLNNLSKRTADLAGALEITSAEQKGTTVSVSIPLKSHFVTGK